jgi:pilus assembly protein Flp/PilA
MLRIEIIGGNVLDERLGLSRTSAGFRLPESHLHDGGRHVDHDGLSLLVNRMLPVSPDDAGTQDFAGSVATQPAGNARMTERDFSSTTGVNVMKSLMMSSRNFLREEDGVTAIEYGLLAALVAVVISGGAALLGTNLNALFNSIAGCLSAAPAACSI